MYVSGANTSAYNYIVTIKTVMVYKILLELHKKGQPKHIVPSPPPSLVLASDDTQMFRLVCPRKKLFSSHYLYFYYNFLISLVY